AIQGAVRVDVIDGNERIAWRDMPIGLIAEARDIEGVGRVMPVVRLGDDDVKGELARVVGATRSAAAVLERESDDCCAVSVGGGGEEERAGGVGRRLGGSCEQGVFVVRNKD